jgi:hypothetical protein
MKYKIYIILALIFFTSCCREAKYYNIPDDERFKFKYDDRFIYFGNKGTIDTLQIWEFGDKYFSWGKSESLLCDNGIFEEVQGVSLNKISNNEIAAFMSFMQKYTVGKNLEMYTESDYATDIVFVYTDSDRTGIKSYTYNGENFTFYKYIPAQ